MQLTINGKVRKLVWGTGCFEDVCDRLGVSLVDLDILMAENESKTLNEITYSALRNGAEIDDDVFELNYKQFLAWLDQEEQGTGDLIMKDFLASKYLGKTMQDYYNDLIARFEASETENSGPAVKKKRIVSEKS